MTASDYLERVAGLPCVICLHKIGVKVYGVDVHHVGDASDRDDWAVASLCLEHHRGATGVHGLHRRGFHRFWKTTDIMLLAWTTELLSKERG